VQKQKTKLVKVEILDLRWFYHETEPSKSGFKNDETVDKNDETLDKKDFGTFANILHYMPFTFGASKFTTILFDQYWRPIMVEIFWKQFVPYIALVIMAIWYFIIVLQPKENRDQTSEEPNDSADQ